MSSDSDTDRYRTISTPSTNSKTKKKPDASKSQSERIVMDLRKLAFERVMFLTMAGSHAYGTNTKTSDVDTRGIFLPPKVTQNSPFFKIEQVETKTTEKDEVIYNLVKFIDLYVDMNPNILELLWVDKGDILKTSPAYEILRQARSQLLSKKVKHTFTGYAFSQIKRIKGHQRWINNPQQERKPLRTDFLKIVYDHGIDSSVENKVVPEHMLKGYKLYKLYGHTYAMARDGAAALLRADSTLDVTQTFGSIPTRVDFTVVFDEAQYDVAYADWKNYWDWKENRNEVRSDLELKFGYDTKHASHCVRLLRMGVEILEDQGVIVKRPDAAELLEIRSGAWSYEKVLEYAEAMEKKIEALYETTSLPHASDKILANNILMEIIDAYATD